MGHHVAKEGAQVGKLVVILARHLVDEAALAVDHLVVADGQHEILAEGVEETEGDFVVVVGTVDGVAGHIAEHIVHPAHVPLEVEAQAAVGRRFGDVGPGGGLLGDHILFGVAGQDGGVQLLEEGDGLEVLLAAVDVLLPLAVAAVVVQVQHGRHRVHPQAVDVVLLQPVQSAGDQEALHFVHAEVEDHGAPFLVLAAAGVGVLIAGLAVEHIQAELVLGEVRGHPVHDDADAGVVHLVHKGHQVLGGAVAAGGGKVARHLVAPAAVEGVFHDGQQLDVGVAHLGDVGDQQVGQLGVVVGHIGAVLLLFHLPAAGVHLVDVHGAVDEILGLLRLLPGGVGPVKAGQVVDLAAVGRPGLGVEGVGVGLKDQVPGPGGDAVLVDVEFLHARDEQFPDGSAVDLLHGVAARLPAVEIAHHAYSGGVGGPQAEHDALFPALFGQVGTKEALGLKVVALFVQVDRQVVRVGFDLLGRLFCRRLLCCLLHLFGGLFQFIGLFHILCSSSLAQTDASPHILRDKCGTQTARPNTAPRPRLSLHYYIK